MSVCVRLVSLRIFLGSKSGWGAKKSGPTSELTISEDHAGEQSTRSPLPLTHLCPDEGDRVCAAEMGKGEVRDARRERRCQAGAVRPNCVESAAEQAVDAIERTLLLQTRSSNHGIDANAILHHRIRVPPAVLTRVVQLVDGGRPPHVGSGSASSANTRGRLLQNLRGPRAEIVRHHGHAARVGPETTSKASIPNR